MASEWSVTPPGPADGAHDQPGRKRFEVVTSFEPEEVYSLPPDEYRRCLDEAMFKLATDIADQRDQHLATLRAGHRFCAHGNLDFATEEDPTGDRITVRARQRGHTLKPGEVCDFPDRTEYGPPKSEITVNRLTTRRPIESGDCPSCGKPGARWIISAVGEPAVFAHATDADHVACPNVRDQLLLQWYLKPEAWEQAYAEVFDRYAIGSSGAPFGITVPPDVLDDPKPDPLDSIKEMYRKLMDTPGHGDGPQVVPPEMVERARVAADLPPAPYIVVRWCGRILSEWLKPDPVANVSRVDPMGSLWGRQLFRTGEYLARPNPEAVGGFDIAEIMDTP